MVKHSIYKYEITPKKRDRFSISILTEDAKEYIVQKPDFIKVLVEDINKSRMERRLKPLSEEVIRKAFEKFIRNPKKANYTDPLIQEIVDSVGRCVRNIMSGEMCILYCEKEIEYGKGTESGQGGAGPGQKIST